MQFITLIIAAAMILGNNTGIPVESPMETEAPQTTEVGADFKVIKDEVKNGVRYVTAVPSAKVCSKQIDIQIDVKTRKILKCSFTRGCPGNAIGLCSLIEGMTCDQVITKLQGINCAGRGTSCPDQLTRVLKSLKW